MSGQRTPKQIWNHRKVCHTTMSYSEYSTTPPASRRPFVTCCPFDFMISSIFRKLPWPVRSSLNHPRLSAIRCLDHPP